MNALRYYARPRGEETVQGPFSTVELRDQLQAGSLSPCHLVLAETGRTPRRPGVKPWEQEWVAISRVPELALDAPPIVDGFIAPRQTPSDRSAGEHAAATCSDSGIDSGAPAPSTGAAGNPEAQPVDEPACDPVWSHAMAGLKWGALVGVGLKLLDTFVALASVDPMMALLFAGAVVVCCVPRIGVIGIIVISLWMTKYSSANFFLMAGAAALVGAVLGSLPGMAIGGIVGLCRKGHLPRVEGAPELSPGDALARAVVLPALGGGVLLAMYFLVVNPWIYEVLERQ